MWHDVHSRPAAAWTLSLNAASAWPRDLAPSAALRGPSTNTMTTTTSRAGLHQWSLHRRHQRQHGQHGHEDQRRPRRPSARLARDRSVAAQNGSISTSAPPMPEPGQAQAPRRRCPHMRRHVLQRLEHPEEIPLRPDAGRRRRERIGLDAQLPRVERRQPREQRQRQRPAKQPRAARNAARTESDGSAAADGVRPARRPAARSSRGPARAQRCRTTSTVAIIGRIATCMPKAASASRR